MTHDTWRRAVADIRRQTAFVSSTQKQLGRIAGIKLPNRLPELVAAARLQNALAVTLGLEPAAPSTEFQEELLKELSEQADVKCSPRDRREAGAWIAFLRLKLRQRSLERLKLQSNDVVQFIGMTSELEQVSSISDDGRVYFRGGLGRGAWPDQLAVACRWDDESSHAREIRRMAANQRLQRSRAERWSVAKQAELSEFQVVTPLTQKDVVDLLATLEDAKDERPIQKLVESRPQLLTSLIGGERRFCIPKVRLGVQYLTDFLIAGVDSLGIRWMLIELETPQSSVTLLKSNELDSHARKGRSQIDEWREWLANNLDYARRSRRDGGVGLPDVRSLSDGIVIVGRRGRLRENADIVRLPIREQNRIEIHTYDWWVERLRAILSYDGPWGLNPHLILRQEEEAGW